MLKALKKTSQKLNKKKQQLDKARQQKVRQLSKSLLFSPHGRLTLKVTRILAEPLTFYTRWWMTQRIKHNAITPAISDKQGYLKLDPTILPEINDIIPVCEQIYAEKAEALHNIQHALKGKNKFFTELLSDSDLRRYPELVDFALNPKLLHLVSAYLDTIPTLKRVGLMVSTMSIYEETKYSQYFHFDHGDFRQIKVFLNITDVLPENGPLTFIPAELSRKIKKHLNHEIKLGKTQRPEPERYFDEDILRYCNESDYVAGVGPKGSGLMVDTSRCLHFGSRVESGYRLLLMLNYTTYHTLCDIPTNVFDKSRYHHDRLSMLALENNKEYELNHFYTGFDPSRKR